MKNVSSPESGQLSQRRRWLWVFSGAFVLCVIFVAKFSSLGMSEEQLLEAARARSLEGDFEKARELIGQYLQTKPESSEALFIAGNSEWRRGNSSEALSLLDQVADDGTVHSIAGWQLSVEIAFKSGQVSFAERPLRRILQRDPTNYDANDKLITILRFSGRHWEMLPLLRNLIKTSHFEVEHLLPAGEPEVLWIFPDDHALADRCMDASDVSVQIGFVREELIAHRVHRDVLQDVVARAPQQIEAQAWLGYVLLEFASGVSQAKFRQWHAALPESADSHPEIWFVRGLWAQQEKDYSAAARCFWEALRRHPNHKGANYRLSQMLVALNREADAQPFVERSSQLASLKYLVGAIPTDWSKVSPTVEMLEALGRNWEAIGWCEVALQKSDVSWARETLQRLRATTDSDAPMTLIKADPAQKIDLSALPLPKLDGKDSARPRSQTGSLSESEVSFAATELDFSYFNGADRTAGRTYMFEFSGGGVAALDFDGDSWADVYLTQGCDWPVDPAQQQYHNRLFRNQSNGAFLDVTGLSGLGDNGFGQGATVGDFNNDGFADVYVANIGENRLYENNGDGTFSDVTSDSGLSGKQWTLSCVLADLNGDSFPDLYDVNYLAGPEVFTRACLSDGRPIQCYPADFPAEQDRLYLNQGDGTFGDATVDSGIVAPGGKGMGIVAADFDGSRRLSLFVANDMTANFFFTNQTPRPGEDVLFEDHALLSGLGFNQDGHADSCMGIAAGDVNQDGMLDLFVTNFQNESNNLFVQQPNQLFEDLARDYRLGDFGFSYEGWGTQFLDGDLDGWPDILVANGHLENISETSRMPLQYYRNLGHGQFSNVSAGDYFLRLSLGRAIATADWNRDGKEDFVVTHVDARPALLTNRTEKHGHFLAVQLRGTQSSRDAIGARVRVTAGGKTWTRQLMAGDGFQASNQRQLIFGLGDAERVESVTVSWPAGSDQTLTTIEVDHELVIVEDVQQAFSIPR